MEATPAAKQPAILALRCLGPECDALMAYEVSRDNVLYIDLSWTARRDRDLTYLPCPKCGGRNVLTAIETDKGKAFQVSRYVR